MCPKGPAVVPRRLPAGGWFGEPATPTIPAMIHDVDQMLEAIVRRDALNGSAVELVFDAPTKDWVARRSAPAVDLYLYDIREDLERRVPNWEDVRDDGGLVKERRQPARRFRLAYLVTAWTQRPEDEHRLLSSLLSCFLRNAMIKPGDLEGTLAEPDLPVYIDVAQPPAQDRSLADVWSALGGELKPSLDVVVTAPMMVGRSAPYGGPVLAGPTIGIASSGGASETVAAGAGRPNGSKDPADAPIPEETAGAAAGKPGVALRVHGLRTR
jgi:Pvc16 N-terminal domain